MRIGIDLRAMQIGHQFRGIGEVLRNACRELDRLSPATDEVVAFFDPAGPPVDHFPGMLFTSGRATTLVPLPGPGSKFARRGDPLAEGQAQVMADTCDVLVQLDFQLGVPETVPTVLIVHDQIPLELGDWYPHIYWPHYRAARRRGMGRRLAAERALRRRLYEHKLTLALRRAAHVIVYSRHSRATTLRFADEHRIDGLAERTSVIHLGHRPAGTDVEPLYAMDELRLRAFGLVDTPFLVYLGGADDRRRIDLLVQAFNALRAAGTELKLVLAGDTFGGLAGVGSEAARTALVTSSYLHDIHLLGYVSVAERDWLYDRAEAFVFPSEYEGFGLPVVEALAAGCAVVAFDTTSIPEVAGPNCELVEGTAKDLTAGIEAIMARSPDRKEADTAAGIEFAARFTWDALGEQLRRQLDRLGAA